MAQRTTTELKVFLEGTLAQYNALIDKTGTVFFDKDNHAVYAKGECIIKSDVASVELVAPTGSTEKTIIKITYLNGTSAQIDTAIPDEFVRFKVSQNLTDEQKQTARTNIGAEAADDTILKEVDVVNDLSSDSITAPLSAAQGKELNATKVDKVPGKQLSTEDFTTALKQKLDGLNNYDDTKLELAITTLTARFDTLLGSEDGDADEVINTFNEIVAFLNNIKETDTLDGVLKGISEQFNSLGKRVGDLEGASKVESINELSGAVTIKGETQNVDDEGYRKVTPITFETSNQGIVAKTDAESIAILAVKQLMTNALFKLENISISEDVTETDYELKLVVDNTPKVWSF